MTTFRDDMAALAAELQQIPEELGMRPRAVKLRVVTYTGRNAATQQPGVKTVVDTAITPTPKVKEADLLITRLPNAMIPGGVIEEGDLFIKNIPLSYTEEQLRGATAWVVADIEYRLVGLVEKDLFFEAMVRRAKA